MLSWTGTAERNEDILVLDPVLDLDLVNRWEWGVGDDVALEIGKPMQKYFYFIQLVQYSDCQSIYQRD